MIKKVQLYNFRGYENLKFETDNSLNVLIGKNGQGKTNFLESIYFLSILRSFRTSKIKEVKRIGTAGFAINAKIKDKNDWNTQLDVEYYERRKLKIDEVNVSKASEFIKQIKTVVFSPDDIRIVTDNSSTRRRFLDMMICIDDQKYMFLLNDYQKALQSRNKVLRGTQDVNTVKAYEPLLAENGCKISEYRLRYIKLLEEKIIELLPEKYQDNDLKIKYKTHEEVFDTGQYLIKLDKDRDRDIQRGYTGFGIQNDDFDFIYKNKNLRQFGSNGQCRIMSLCLKMAKVKIFSEHEGEENEVVVLVDDVTGDLDDETRHYFFNIISKTKQRFFTFTSKPKDEYFADAAFYKVEDNKIDLMLG